MHHFEPIVPYKIKCQPFAGNTNFALFDFRDGEIPINLSNYETYDCQDIKCVDWVVVEYKREKIGIDIILFNNGEVLRSETVAVHRRMNMALDYYEGQWYPGMAEA